jgi:hypothetical protein
MRLANVIFFGSIAAVAVLTAPALANNSDAQKSTDKSASSPCKAYQQAPDGSWTPLPCQEMGAGQAAQRKSATRSSDQKTR